jgi:cytosine/adenosine deaminase-related metal-dependent hydrolase
VLSKAWQDNSDAPANILTARDMLQIATLNGAHVAGLESRTGSLTPGKRADVILLDARAINMVPVIDPVAAVTLCADVSNVDTVLVDGVARKRGGRLLTDPARARNLVDAARDRLVQRAAAKRAAAQEASP